MPRVSINKKEYMKRDLVAWIVGKMYGRYTQTDLARKLDISQPALSHKLKTGRFDFSELVIIFDFLEATPEEKVRLLTL